MLPPLLFGTHMENFASFHYAKQQTVASFNDSRLLWADVHLRPNRNVSLRDLGCSSLQFDDSRCSLGLVSLRMSCPVQIQYYLGTFRFSVLTWLNLYSLPHLKSRDYAIAAGFQVRIEI